MESQYRHDGWSRDGLMQNEALTIHQTRETFGLNSSDGPEWLVAAATADEAEEKVIEFLASQSVEVTPAEEGEVEEFRAAGRGLQERFEACKRIFCRGHVGC